MTIPEVMKSEDHHDHINTMNVAFMHEPIETVVIIRKTITRGETVVLHRAGQKMDLLHQEVDREAIQEDLTITLGMMGKPQTGSIPETKITTHRTVVAGEEAEQQMKLRGREGGASSTTKILAERFLLIR